jgi:hypothetical protein
MPLFGRSKSKAPKAPSVYKDKHLDKGAKPQNLGGGTANEVYKTRYKDKYSPTEKEGYFKEDTDQARAKYGVGASRLATGLGLGSIIPETNFAEHQIVDPVTGKKRKAKGAMSLKATGESLGGAVVDDQTEKAKSMNGGTLPGDREVAEMWTGWTKRGDKMFSPAGNEVADVDLSAGHTQRQLNQLQWFDALIGNKDRHDGNILIDPTTGNITGIDNDLSFGNGIGTDDEGFLGGTNDKYLGLPSMIDEDTANKLLGLTPDAIAGMLNPKGAKKSQKFSDDELQQTYARLAEIQKAVQGKVDAGELVKQWDQSTYDKQSKEKARKGMDSDISASYLSRHHRSLQRAKDTGEDQIWRRGHRVGDTTPAPQQPTTAPVQQSPVATAPPLASPRTIPRPAPPSTPPPTRPTGGLRRPDGHNALRRSPNANRPLPQVPVAPSASHGASTPPRSASPRPTGGLRRPEGYNALRNKQPV